VGGGSRADAEVGGKEWSSLGEEIYDVSGEVLVDLLAVGGCIDVRAHCSAMRKGSSAFIAAARVELLRERMRRSEEDTIPRRRCWSIQGLDLEVNVARPLLSSNLTPHSVEYTPLSYNKILYGDSDVVCLAVVPYEGSLCRVVILRGSDGII